MRSRTWGVVVVVCGGIAAPFVACGGDSGTIGDAGTDTGANDGTSSMMDSGNGNDTGSGGDASDAGNNGDGSTSSDAAAEGSTPNAIACGGSTCMLPNNICCTTALSDGGIGKACLPEGQCQGTKSECDDKTDCQNNQLCCLNFNNGLVEGQCANACNNRPQLCLTNGECANMMPCTGYTCPMNQGVKTCSKPMNCN